MSNSLFGAEQGISLAVKHPDVRLPTPSCPCRSRPRKYHSQASSSLVVRDLVTLAEDGSDLGRLLVFLLDGPDHREDVALGLEIALGGKLDLTAQDRRDGHYRH